jgi:microcompartment protein CcmK/EutM
MWKSDFQIPHSTSHIPPSIMDFGRVIGRVVCVVKDPKLENLPLLIIEGCDHSGAPAGARMIAADGIGVGQNEFVWYETSGEAPLAWERKPPVDAAIVGIADHITTVQAGSTPKGKQP